MNEHLSREQHIEWCKNEISPFLNREEYKKAIGFFQIYLGNHPGTLNDPHRQKITRLAFENKINSLEDAQSIIAELE